jgi:hypothetical protein
MRLSLHGPAAPTGLSTPPSWPRSSSDTASGGPQRSSCRRWGGRTTRCRCCPGRPASTAPTAPSPSRPSTSGWSTPMCVVWGGGAVRVTVVVNVTRQTIWAMMTRICSLFQPQTTRGAGGHTPTAAPTRLTLRVAAAGAADLERERGPGGGGAGRTVQRRDPAGRVRDLYGDERDALGAAGRAGAATRAAAAICPRHRGQHR